MEGKLDVEVTQRQQYCFKRIYIQYIEILK